MADSDKLYISIGLKDEITDQVKEIMKKVNALSDACDDISEKGMSLSGLKIGDSKSANRDLRDTQDILNQITESIFKLSNARIKFLDVNADVSKIDELLEKLRVLRTEVVNMTTQEDVKIKISADASIVNDLENRITSLVPTLKEIGDALNEAMLIQSKSPNEGVQKTIDQLSAEYESLKKTIDSLYTSYLQFRSLGEVNMAKQLGIEHLEESFGSAGMAAQKHATRQRELTETFNAYFEEIEKEEKEKAEAAERETKALDEQRIKLKENESIEKSIVKLRKDAESQQNVAKTLGRKSELDALKTKLRDIKDLEDEITKERSRIAKDSSVVPIYTKEYVSQRLDEIQRRYNENLAKGKKLEREDADAKRKNAEATKEATQAYKDLASAYEKVASSGKDANSITAQLNRQIGSYVSLLGMERLVKNIIQIGGEFELQHIALRNILGDIQHANSMFEQMKELAVVSPFNFRQLATYSKQIAAFGIPYEEMFDTTKRLADMSAGLGVDMGRLILAYGQVRSAAVLRGQELRQFTEAGIPLVRALADEFTKLNGRAVSTSEVFELISKRAVPFGMVKKVLWDMTNEGGRFYDMQYELSDTLLGKWSNLRDAWEIMLSEIAKGESLSGKMFKTLVSWTTMLVENVNTVLPVLTAIVTSMGVAKLSRHLSGFGKLGFSGIDQNIEKAQKLRAIELARMKINGEISRAKYTELMRMNMNKSNYYQVLAMEGKLNVLQIQKAYQQGHINKQQLKYLVQLRTITNEQRKQIILGQIATGTLGQLKNSAKGMFQSLNSYLGKGGWIMIALDVIATTALTIYDRISEINRKNEELVNGFSNGSKELKENLAGMTSTPTNNEDYKSAIDGMKEMLKQHSSNYDAVMSEVNAVDALSQKYEILKKALEDTQKVYSMAELNAPSFADATRSYFEDAKEWARELSKKKGAGRFEFSIDWDELQYRRNEDIFVSRIKKLAEKIKEEIPNVGKDSLSNGLFRKLRDSLEEEIGVGAREKLFINVKLNELLNIQDADALTDIVTEKFSTVVSTTEKTIANKIKYGQALNEAENKKVSELVNAAIEDTRKLYPEFSNTLQQLLNDSNFVARIQLKFAETGSANELQKQIYSNFGYAPVSENTKIIATQWGISDSWYDARNKAKQDIDKLYNELVSTEEAYTKQKAKAEDVTKKREDYEEAINAALLGLGYDYKGEKKKSNKEPKGSKTDEILKQWKEEWSELKAFYSEFKKWAKKVGDDAALKKLYESGLWGGLFNADGTPKYDMKDWGKAIDAFSSKLSGGTTERNKFLFEVGKAKVDFEYDINEKELDRALNELQEYLSRQTEKWNLYKTILEKTGDQRLAGMAFGDGKIWTDLAREFADELRTRMEEAAKPLPDVAWDMTNAEAKEYFEGVQGGYETWKKVVDLIRGEYRDALTKGADAEAQLLTVSDKIRKNEEEIARLRKEGANVPGNEARIRVLQKENDSKLWEQFQQGSDYLRFFGAVLTMTNSEVEQTARMIKERLITELSRGTISAHQYTKSLKEVDDQLTKSREAFGGYLGTLLQSGMKGVVDRRSEDVQNAAIRVEAAKKEREEIEGRLRRGEEVSALERMTAITEEIEAKQRLEAAAKALGISVKQYQTLTSMESVLGVVNGVLEGLQHVATSLSQMFDALGDEGNANYFSDMADTIGGISSVLTPVNNLVQSVKNGNISGAISSALSAPVDLIAGPITAFAKLNDKQLQREIEASAQRQKEMERLTSNLERLLERSIGGIYGLKVSKRQIAALQETAAWQRSGFGVQRSYTSKEAMDALKEAEKTKSYYDASYASLLLQRDELAHQMALEEEKKDSDSDKIADYKQQLAEMEDEIRYFAKDMAKALWDIDVKSWAKELTDTIVDAWKNGEDAVDAYRNKVKEMMLDLTTNILSQRVMEKMLDDVGLNTLIENLMTSTKGELNADAVSQLADKLNEVSEKGATTITAILDKMEEQGYISKGDEGSSGSSASIKGITEQTADLLAAYINSIRADVSMKRVMEAEYYPKFLAAMSRNMLTEAQEKSLLNIAAYTKRNAEAAEGIMELLRRVETGATKFNVR